MRVWIGLWTGLLFIAAGIFWGVGRHDAAWFMVAQAGIFAILGLEATLARNVKVTIYFDKRTPAGSGEGVDR